ncbi:uncharacterized protein JN550_004701 [Neoarthrinium moseri]|uniref:uncharacterized protein n=1 Tax=Neoarthrinium moseri TaxID=1658444 RepID=UPI001FDBEF17|nr:uncharacterized protein JN550_004701 [Neoarthrinium moseri]KAI1871256.1 hypothetical protein JN550_004701 [Neoarthrinium moseri]
MLNNYFALKSRPRASSKISKNIKTWLSNNIYPIHEKETKFLDAEDLITTAASPKSVIREVFERWVLCRTRGLFGLFRLKPRPKSDDLDPDTVYGKDEPVDIFASISVFVAAFAMLIAPLWILAVLDDMFKKLGVITAFITGLLAALTSATLAKPFEILAVAAGYSAVLVVFLQIGGMTIATSGS